MDYPLSKPDVDLYLGKFTDGDPLASIPASRDPADTQNAIIDELLAVIIAGGLTPNEAVTTQVRDSIRAQIISAQKAVIITSAVFEASVSNGEAVYWDSANSRFDEAIADGTAKQNAVGIADVTNSKVYAFGDTVLFSGLTPGGRYYLSDSVAGGITISAPSSNVVQIGIAKSATEVFVDIDIMGSASLPTGYKTGFTLANNVTDANNDIDIAAGKCRDTTDAYDIGLAASITKRLDAAWAAGTNAGGLFTGSKANSTWYHCFAIVNTITGVSDVGFDTSITAANCPIGYSYRYLNSIKTNGSGNILGFLNVGLDMWWKVPIRDVGVINVAANTTTNYVISTPPGIRAIAKLYGFANGVDAAINLAATDSTTITLNITATTYNGGIVGTSTSSSDYTASMVEVLTNTAAEVKVTTISSALIDIAVVCAGWRLPNN